MSTICPDNEEVIVDVFIQELQQVVKLGRAGEAARESAGEAGAPTDALLTDYALTPQPATALRTPAHHQDRFVLLNITNKFWPQNRGNRKSI